jgi:hypothetical protein
MSDSRRRDPPGQRRADTLTATHHYIGSRRDSGASQRSVSGIARESMIPKSVQRFSEKIMLQQKEQAAI